MTPFNQLIISLMNDSEEYFYHLTETDSTNHFALQILESPNTVHGTAILTDFQTAGKGQKGSRWESERGKNMLASFVFFPDFLQANELFKINQLVSLSVCEVLEDFGEVPFQIKWPNDVLYNNRKIAGILIENSIRGGLCQHSIVGIGINVNQEHFEFYDTPAVSLSMILGKELDDIPALTLRLRDRILYHMARLRMDDSYDIDLSKNYMVRLLGLNQLMLFQYEGKNQEGEITGVDKNGQLMVRFQESMTVVGPKEIKFILK